LAQNAPGSSNLRPPTGPPQPIEQYGAQRRPGQQDGSTGPYGNSLGPNPVQSYGTPAQYNYATTGNASSLTTGMSGLTMTLSRPRVISANPNQVTTASAGESRAPIAPISRSPGM